MLKELVVCYGFFLEKICAPGYELKSLIHRIIVWFGLGFDNLMVLLP